jgi:dynamin 1-like protein
MQLIVEVYRGYVAVVNRSQKDIADGVAIRKGLTKEASFFSAHPKYRTMITKCGTTNLARSLNQILMLHIRDCLPEIKSKITSLMSEVQGGLNELGDPTDSQEGGKLGSTMLCLISRFSTSFNETVDGRKGGDLGGVDTSELYGGARISHIFNEVFGKCVKALDPFAGLSDADIRTAIANANGPRAALFVPEISFDLLVRRQIVRLEQPGLQCVDLVFSEMQRMACQSETGELSRFPALRDRVFEIVNQILRAALAPTQIMISNIIHIELAYINTSHPDFIGGKQAVAQLTKRLAPAVADPAKGLSSPAPSQQPRELSENNVPVNNFERPASGAFTERSHDPLTSPSPSSGSEAPRGFFGLFRPTGAGPNTGARDRAQFTVKESAGGLVKLPQVPDRLQTSSQPQDREKIETEIIKNLISSYFDIVKKNFADLVPKTIMHFLVNSFKEGLQNSLVSELYRDAVIQDLMKENEDVAAKRKGLREMRDLLQHALEIVNEVRDFNSFK